MNIAAVISKCIAILNRRDRTTSGKKTALLKGGVPAQVKIAKSWALISILTMPTAGITMAGDHIHDSLAAKVALTRAVSNGMSLDEAVAETIQQNPYQGKETVAAAFSIMNHLPKAACAIRRKDGILQPTSRVNYKACRKRIIHSAIAAGTDPSQITSPSAAGGESTSSPENKGRPSEQNITPLEQYLRKLLMFGSMSHPN